MQGLYIHRIFSSLRSSRVFANSRDSISLTWHVLFIPGPLMRRTKSAPVPYRFKSNAPRRLSLLDMPPEIFEQIIDYVVAVEKAKDLFRHRRVCSELYKACDEELPC